MPPLHTAAATCDRQAGQCQMPLPINGQVDMHSVVDNVHSLADSVHIVVDARHI